MFKGLIRRPIAVIMVLIAVIVLGIAAIRLLPVSLVPDIDIPQMTVQVSSPDKSARELNETMVSRLRSELVQIPHLDNIVCEVKDGSGTITMRFEYGSDADYIFMDVNERIDRAMSGWPSGEERPTVMRASATDIPAFFVNVTLKDDVKGTSNRFMEMSDFTRQVIVRRFEQLPEVAMVDITGQVFPEMLIIPDMEKLNSLGISEQELASAISGANVRLGNLSIRDGEYRFNVRFESIILTVEDIMDIYLKLNGRVFQIKDLATVREQPQMRKGIATSDGKPTVTLAVIKRTEAKMADLKKSVKELSESFATDYPDMEFTVTRDQTELLDYSINNMVSNLLFGALFACLIIFFFMQDFKSPSLVVFTIPTALIMSFLMFYVLHISINIISLSGLVLGLGMMVDNSIIVIDNITQRWGKGEPLEQACVKGSQEVFAPMLSSVLTTCAIFVPLVFMSGISGALFYDEAMAVTITLFAALFVSVLVIPVFYYQLYKNNDRFVPNRFISKISVGDMTVGYERLMKWFFRHRGVMWGIFGTSLLLIGILFLCIGKERLPQMSHNDTLLKIEWNQRVTAEENNRRCSELTANFADLIEQSTIMAGVQQFAMSHTGDIGPTEAVIYMKTRSTHDVETLEAGISEYMQKNWPHAVFSCKASGNIFDMIFADKEATLTAHIRKSDGSTPEPNQLNEILEKIRQALPDVYVSPAEWNEYIEMVTSPEKLALYGVSFSQIDGYLRQALGDNSVMRVVKGNTSVPIIIGSDRKETADLIQNNYLRTGDGGMVPLETLLMESRNRDLKNITSGMEGEYYNLELEPARKEIKSTMKTIQEIVRQDDRFDVSFGGSYFSNREMVKELCMVLLISVLLLFFILAAQFESLIQPCIIMSELIIDIFFTLAVLFICGETLNLMSMIGLVVMCGIVINDSILKVDTINHLRRGGMSLKRSIFEAGNRRLKAILMTSLTTILAIAPFLVKGNMGSDLQFPLSLALISGMIAGTFVSVFFVPLCYYAVEKHKEHRNGGK